MCFIDIMRKIYIIYLFLVSQIIILYIQYITTTLYVRFVTISDLIKQ